jgi:hypothetical protein
MSIPPLEQDDDEGKGAEVLGDMVQVAGVDEAGDRPDDDADPQKEQDVGNARPLEENIAEKAGQDDETGNQYGKGDRHPLLRNTW